MTRGKNKRILIVLPVNLYPPKTGGEKGVYNMIDKLRSCFSVAIIFKSENKKDDQKSNLQELWPDVSLFPFAADYKNKSGKLALEFKRSIKKCIHFFKEKLSGDPDYDLKRRSCLYINNFLYPSSDFVSFVQNVIDQDSFDIIQIEFFHLITLIDLIKTNAKTVYVHHEIRFVRANREMGLMHKKGETEEILVERLKEMEIEYLKKYDYIITLTNHDKQLLEDYIAEDRLFASPLSIGEERSEQIVNNSFENKIVFFGGSGHYPNVDALNWFLQDVWRKLAKEYPSLSLLVTGMWENRYKRGFENYPNVKFPGFVDDLVSVVKGSILIVPVRIGSGMRMKILEAVNLGIPFISTSVGAEGMHFQNNRDCILADTSEDFHTGLINLITSPELRSKFIKNATAHVKHEFDVNKAGDIRISALQKILNIHEY